jgi:hypothetical protein
MPFHADTAYEYRGRLAATWLANVVGRGRLSQAPMTVTMSWTGILWYLL